MSAPETPIDDRYEAYASCVRALHCLFVEGRGESDEADALRDRMDAPWEALDAEQRVVVSGLTADLNWIRREPARPAGAQEAAAAEDVRRLEAARKDGDWRGALEILRRVAPSLPRPRVAYLRALLWKELGDAASAQIFFEHATSFGLAGIDEGVPPAPARPPVPSWARSERMHITRPAWLGEARP